MNETFNERLKRLIYKEFGSVSDFAKKIGKTSQTVDNWIPRESTDRLSKPRREKDYDVIAEALKVSKAYLLTGEDSSVELKAIAHHDELNKIVHINLINVTVGAGNGHHVYFEEVIDTLEISKFFLKAYGLLEPFDCSAVTVVGDSMFPALRSGDIVIVDHTQKTPSDGVYVVRIEDTVLVKNVAKLPGRKVKIFSHAVGFPEHELSLEEDDFQIIGRVVWGGRRF